jgi:hypothetical protein
VASPRPEEEYRVWAVEGQEWPGGFTRTIAVSAESEYGAIKRLCGNRAVVVLRVEVIEGREPQYAQRRIEGYTDHEFRTDERWEYTP